MTKKVEESAREQVCRIFDALSEEIVNMTDTDILAEMTPADHENCAQLKTRMLRIVAEFKAKVTRDRRQG